jgi:dynein heavy chain
VTCENGVENWIKNVERTMRESLKKLLAITYNDYSRKKDSKVVAEWVENHLGQLLITASQIIWTSDCDSVLKAVKASDKPDKSKLWKGLREEKAFFLVELTKLVRKAKTLVTRLKLIALITIEVHARDIT